MRKIINIFAKSGFPIVDEADTVLNVLHEVSFSGGRSLPPHPYELELLSQVYQHLYENPAIKALAHLESDPQAEAAAPQLTEKLYRDQLQLPLAESLINSLREIKLSSPQLAAKVQTFARNLSADDRTHLLHYLCRDKRHLESAERYYQSLDPEIRIWWLSWANSSLICCPIP